MKNTRLKGHVLLREGDPFDHRKRMIRALHNTPTPGRAMCECGAMSKVLPSGGARKRWHKEHKAAMTPTPASGKDE